MQRFLPRHQPPSHLHPRGAADGLRIRWLGTAGHVVQTASTTILLDPFLSRPGLLRTGLTRLQPSADAWWRWLPDSVDAMAGQLITAYTEGLRARAAGPDRH